MQSKARWIGALGAITLVAGCLNEDSHTIRYPDGAAPENQPPVITGSPTQDVVAGDFYEFLPQASDPEGDALDFSVANKPAWARFDSASGRLWGTPGAADVGESLSITISVTDGHATASLAAFGISVNQVAAGSATLSWQPPTANSDGSVLSDLAGYRIYYGRDENNLSQVVVLGNPGLTRYVVENLSTARWYFAMTSVNGEGIESQRSQTVSKSIG